MVAAMNQMEYPSDVTIPLQDLIPENGLRDLSSEERTPSHNKDPGNNKQNVSRCGLKLSKTNIFIVLLVLSFGISLSYNIFLLTGGKSCSTTEEKEPSVTVKMKQLKATSTLGPCPEGWHPNGKSCYFFSQYESTWDASLRNCSSYGASLLVPTTPEEMTFTNENKEHYEYWLGLEREDRREPWKLQDGSDFKVWFDIKGEGRCASLNDGVVSSTVCNSQRRWICRKSLHAD